MTVKNALALAIALLTGSALPLLWERSFAEAQITTSSINSGARGNISNYGFGYGYTLGQVFTGDPLFEYGYGSHPFHIFSDNPAVVTVIANPTVNGTATLTVTPVAVGTAHFIISDVYGQKLTMNVAVGQQGQVRPR